VVDSIQLVKWRLCPSVPLELKLMRVGGRHHAMIKHSTSLGNAEFWYVELESLNTENNRKELIWSFISMSRSWLDTNNL